jgi:hypothetical protein
MRKTFCGSRQNRPGQEDEQALPNLRFGQLSCLSSWSLCYSEYVSDPVVDLFQNFDLRTGRPISPRCLEQKSKFGLVCLVGYPTPELPCANEAGARGGSDLKIGMSGARQSDPLVLVMIDRIVSADLFAPL